MFGVERASDVDYVGWAAGVEGKSKTHVSDEVVKALLPVERHPSEGEGQTPGMLHPQGEGSADVVDGGLGDRPKAGRVSPSLPPFR